jgi:hypothetical protein
MGDGEVQGIGELGQQGIAPPIGKSWIMRFMQWNRRRRMRKKKSSL